AAQDGAGLCQRRAPEQRGIGHADYRQPDDQAEKWATEADEYQAADSGGICHYPVEQVVPHIVHARRGAGQFRNVANRRLIGASNSDSGWSRMRAGRSNDRSHRKTGRVSGRTGHAMTSGGKTATVSTLQFIISSELSA